MHSQTRSSRPFLLRQPSREDARIVTCRCLLCGQLVGASGSDRNLRVAERLHHCVSEALPTRISRSAR